MYRSHQSLENRTCTQSVLFESNGATRTYILNRPRKLNALNADMLKLIGPQLEVRVPHAIKWKMEILTD